jgi:hypothetical protein
MRSEKCVICGLHRSGTTFVGNILRHAGALVIHEPLNERFGMLGVPIAYPHVENRGDAFSQLVDDAVAVSRPWNKNPAYIKAQGTRRRLYSLTGGRSGISWGWLRIRKTLGMAPAHLCMKDPFMSLATPYLVNIHGIQVACMVRHPAAIHYSTEKQNWRFDVENLLRQPNLISRYGDDIPSSHWEWGRNSSAASIALLWKMMIRINDALSQQSSRLLLIRHEELCIDPLAATRRLCQHTGVAYTPRLEQFMAERSQGDRIEAKEGRTHDFFRNSRALIDVWRGRISSSDEALIREIAGDEVEQIYDKW